MTRIRQIADNYERNYGFMCINAVRRNSTMDAAGELGSVRSELERRGHTLIESQSDYNAAVAKHGVPPAFEKAPPGVLERHGVAVGV
jgi:hypothetical protein